MNIDEAFNLDLPEHLNRTLLDLSKKLSEAQKDLKTAALEAAIAEHSYRQAKATAYLTAKNTNERATIPQLEAIVDKESSIEMQRAYTARAVREAASELVKSLRAQLNALQSVGANIRAERDLAMGPQVKW